MFKETGHSDAEIDAKLEAARKHFFEGGDDQRVVYAVGADAAYVLDVANDDVRSEGMSYGMMVAVQLGDRTTFDKLWRWTTRNMRHADGPRAGYFAWQCGKDGQKRDQNPASDGEAYFATALLFASARWGNDGAFHYDNEAQAILRVMLHKEDGGVVDSVTNMFNRERKMVVFTPYASAATFTDPSYHLPGFYEVWARRAREDQAFWREAAQTSRTFFPKTVHPTTGLAPDYATFDGAPTGAGHMEFRFDAWRVIGNIAFDHAWWGTHPWSVEQSRRLLGFFRKEGLTTYGNQYELDGRKLSGDHSPGLVAMNAVGALVLPLADGKDFVEELWKLSPPSGRYRYYDGMLYLLGMLHVSGRFQVF